jgi:hypothetical protein
LPAHEKASNSLFKTPQPKRRAWGGREEDDELTKAKKNGAKPPASYDDKQPKNPRVPSSNAQIHGIKLGFLDEKREEGVMAYLL